MKKLYFLALFCCIGFVASAQVTTTIWATSATAFKTGRSTSTLRTDGDLIVGNATPSRGYAVFDLSSIPAGALINDVRIGVWCTSFAGAGVAAGWTTYGYAGDLSTFVTAATLFPPMVSGPILTTETYGTTPGANVVLASTPASTAFIGANAGSLVSICFTGGAPRTYTFTGRTGIGAVPADTSAVTHAPFITITYCLTPSAVTATAGPNPVCAGSTLSLTGTGGAGATNYLWEGPGGYTSTALSPTLTAAIATDGVYTLTAINACGTYSATATATTAAVTVNASPAAITGSSALCEGLGASLSNATPSGSWTSSDGSVATVGLGTGVVVAVAAGTATISYTLASGCYATHSLTVNATPDVITGPTVVCENATITLSNAISGGAWTSSSPNVSVAALTGVVTGVTAGTATITYQTAGCTAVTYDVTINPAPAPIGGPSEVCVAGTITLTDATPGGTWSSSAITTALVSSGGVVTGVSAGTVNIIYTLTSTTGCQAIKVVTVQALPAPITGPGGVCNGQNILLSDATVGGTFGSASPIVSVTGGGVVSGLSAGVATITYTILSTGCYVTTPVTVSPLPAAIIAATTEFCENTSITLTAPDPGGTWTSADVTTATVGSSSGIVTGVGGGMTNITYTLPTTCWAVAAVTINPAPVSVITPASATTFCAGESVILDATPGGVTYQWDNGSGPIAGATDISYTASTSGSYTVDITNGFGCVGTSAPVVVSAGIIAVIDYTDPLNFCIGGSIGLTANPGSATGTISYKWLKDGVDIPGAVFSTHTASVTGVYTASVTVFGGSGSCTVTTPPVTVTVNNLPTPTISFTGTSLVTAGSYASYQWFINSSAIIGATNSSYMPFANGIYRVRTGDAIGCSGYSNAVQISRVGVAGINKVDVKIYPNPATDVVYIGAGAPVRAVVTSIEGKVMLDKNMVQQINVSNLSAGMYIIKLYDEEGEMIMVQKLIKE